MKPGIFQLASLASAALRRAQLNDRKVEALEERKNAGPVRVVSAHCEICGKTHRMGLGEPHCTAPVNLSHGDTETQSERPIFGRVLAMALLVLCMGLSGCSRFYVSGVTVGAGTTGDGKEITAGLTIAPNPYRYDAKQVLPLNSK